MKVIYVIDSIKDIKQKIQLLQNKFGNNILFVVKSKFVQIFQTYSHQVNAIYSKNLSEVIHHMLLKCNELEDVVYLMSSLDINNTVLDKFISAIYSNPTKVVSACPNYSFFEQMSNAAYNIYVKSLFKNEDSLVSAKMQYLPKAFVQEILYSHFGNKLFKLTPGSYKDVYYEDKQFNNSLKTKTGFNKNLLVPIIIALIITAAMFTTLFLLKKINYITILIFIVLYLLDIALTIIYQCKIYFDKRFFDKD